MVMVEKLGIEGFWGIEWVTFVLIYLLTMVGLGMVFFFLD